MLIGIGGIVLVVALYSARAAFILRLRDENPSLVARLNNPTLVDRFDSVLSAAKDKEFQSLSESTRIAFRVFQLLSAALPAYVLLCVFLALSGGP